MIFTCFSCAVAVGGVITMKKLNLIISVSSLNLFEFLRPHASGCVDKGQGSEALFHTRPHREGNTLI
jgi:hypothetical protein